jgi:hypothetical protein
MAHRRMAAPLPAWVLVVLLASLPAFCGADAKNSGTHEGPVTTRGNGEARAFVTLDGEGRPTALGVRMSEAALKGLPAETPGHGPAWEYRLELPEEAAHTGYDHITVDWNPHGHLPPGVYDAAHFDFHFYLINAAERDRITLEGDDLARASRPPAPEFMPAGYVLPEGTAEPRMGAHAIDPGAPEFNNEAFSKTFIYGFHDGRMVFVEPMVTKAFLDSREDMTELVAVPESYQVPGYYPTRYRVGFDPQSNEHVVTLEGLLQHGQTAGN